MKNHQNYKVVLKYHAGIPEYETKVMARSPQSAEQIAMYDAVNNGWPHDWSKVSEIIVEEWN